MPAQRCIWTEYTAPNMKAYFILGCVLNGICIVSGGILEAILNQEGACFDVYETPRRCNRTLSRSFIPKNRIIGNNEPTTAVYLFTPNSTEKAEPLHECGGQLPPNSHYDKDAYTEVIIHGWLDGICRTAWMREMKEQLFLRGKYNVILVDWTWGNTPDYVRAGLNSKVVGEQVGFVINNIMREKGCSAEKFHVVGHSFGAIASGFVGRSVPGLRRITGIDPAYAPFGAAPPNQRLTYRDAKLVDIIHSNGYTCFDLGIGDSRLLGHADFYPNGGQLQMGCYTYMLQALLKMDILIAMISLVDPRICSHVHALQFYTLSINPKRCQYVGVTSSSYASFINRTSRIGSGQWAVMGMDYELHHRNDGKNKKFYLETGDTCPYYDDSYLKGEHFPFNVSCEA